MNLQQALRARSTSRIAFVGAGGKTTAMFQLARQLELPVVVTTTTHLGDWQLGLADRHLVVSRPEDIGMIAGQVEGVTLLTGPEASDRRVGGLSTAALARLFELSVDLGFPVLIEADGSRGKPVKAPGKHEPVIPDRVNHVVICQGIQAVGQPLTDSITHRPEIFSRLSGIHLGEPVTLDGIARVIFAPEGGRKGVPPAARITALLNQATAKVDVDEVIRIAGREKAHVPNWVVSNLESQKIYASIEPAAGIILAAGAAQRYGGPKTLLDWHGKPLIRHAAETALEGGLDPVIVVLGAVVEPARLALDGLPVTVVYNPDWQQGQSTSLRTGIQALPDDTGCAVFLLADQPNASSKLIRELVVRHHLTQSAIIAPYVEGRRSNPVVFDSSTFPDLMELKGDSGGRAIMERHEIEQVAWDDSKLLLDIDTPEDYDRLQRMD